MLTKDLPAGLPPATFRRPSSIGSGDVYGSYPTGVPTTVTDGTTGGARVESAVAEVQGDGPGGAHFLGTPVAVLVVLLAALAVVSYVEA